MTALARYAFAAAIAFGVMAWIQTRSALIDKGETKALAKVEKRNNVIRKKAAVAAAKSRSAPGGVRNPYERD